MSALVSFNRQVESSVRRKDGNTLRDLLRMKSEEAAEAAAEYLKQGGALPAPLAEPWTSLPDLVEKRLAASAALTAKNWVDASDHLQDALSTYVTILSSEDSWSVPLLHALCADVRLLAEEADNQLKSERLKPHQLEKAERVLKRAFTTTNKDRRPLQESSRKIGTLGVINQLLKVYFKLNNLRLCANVTRTVDAPNFPSFESFPGPHRVTYRYFSGRLHLYDHKCEDAVRDLTYAFENMAVPSRRHRRQILLYLIPARILRGSLPSKKMLDDYQMHWFKDISEAIRTGNLRCFDAAVDKHEEFFTQKALYLAVERMRPLVYRSLIQKVCYIAENNKVSFENLRLCLGVCGVDMNTDEIECILANLIFRNYIKGYLSHKVKYLVLSKKNPFPKLKELLAE